LRNPTANNSLSFDPMPEEEKPEDVLADRLLDLDEVFWNEVVDVQTEDEVRLLRKERFAAVIRDWLDGK
jgi:hypothetical protein